MAQLPWGLSWLLTEPAFVISSLFLLFLPQCNWFWFHKGFHKRKQQKHTFHPRNHERTQTPLTKNTTTSSQQFSRNLFKILFQHWVYVCFRWDGYSEFKEFQRTPKTHGFFFRDAMNFWHRHDLPCLLIVTWGHWTCFPPTMQPKVVVVVVVVLQTKSEIVFCYCVLLTYTCHPPPPYFGWWGLRKKIMTCRYLFVRNGLYTSTIKTLIRSEVVSWFVLSRRWGSPTQIPSPRCLRTEGVWFGATRSDVSRGSGWSTRDSFLMGRKIRSLDVLAMGNLWVFPVILPPTPAL